MVHVTAHEAETSAARPPVNLAFVLDSSGSMLGQKLQLAVQAVEEAIRRLKPTDRFSVVTYDDHIDTLVPGTSATLSMISDYVSRSFCDLVSLRLVRLSVWRRTLSLRSPGVIRHHLGPL